MVEGSHKGMAFGFAAGTARVVDGFAAGSCCENSLSWGSGFGMGGSFAAVASCCYRRQNCPSSQSDFSLN